ncbi:uncharacterized protein LOC114881275 [Osmia bicornis bicornis]|uniref:uncharacterized protein LOC114881275 n=1 Tax=Osmia bicornis bicornis TaxID=1437191 RepID=UPI001EAF02E0|nr:uncharacterized protein LOC114881275 [Osmia bicornis bicornis]
MAELCLQELSWDDILPLHNTQRWLRIREDLTSLAKLSIPRWFNTTTTSTVELHGFADASVLAMAAVVYLVVHAPSTAVHFEVVTDYSADAFIAAYRRIAARRGTAASLYSDCGTNFQGADPQLKKQFKDSTCENQDVAALLAKDGTQWHFNPPAAPHMGGKWAAVVKSLKFHLKRTIGDALLTFEESKTLLAQIEAIHNSRPLEPLSDDPDDVSALSPGHFLIGSPLNAVPEPTLLDISVNRLSRWQFVQKRLQQLWRLWSTQYLQRLQAISKWHHPSNEIKVGSFVLITDERLPSGKWPMARVLGLMPGKDGLTRIVTLKTATTTLTRPIAKLAPLHQPSEDNADTQTTSSTSR